MVFPLDVAFSGYTIIGLTLLILASTVAVYLGGLPGKSRATRWLVAFFTFIALSGAATILTNLNTHWDRFFAPWQDAWILAGGAALTYFAFSLPILYGDQRSVESRLAKFAMTGLAALGVVYSIVFDIRYLTQWTPELEVAGNYYLLLPLGTLLVVLIFLRRSVQLSARAGPDAHTGPAGLWQRLVRPSGEDALMLRNLALALSLAFLPGVQTIVQFPYPLGFILSNIGALLATITIALVYFNHASEVTSFMAKLVGITLATVLLIFSVFAAIDVNRASNSLSAQRSATAEAIRSELIRTGALMANPLQVAYVVSWDAARPDDPAGYRQLYRAGDEAGFDLGSFVDANRQAFLAAQTAGTAPGSLTVADWRFTWREQISPRGPDAYSGHQFIHDETAYEIGFSDRATADALSDIVVEWLLLIMVSSAIVLTVFPIFFRNTLVHPLRELLGGVTKVNRGDLDTSVPIRFNDEIGVLTDSFNRLTQSLKDSRHQQETLIGQLQESRDELEERVTDRTRELSTFTELTILPGEYDELADILQPALSRIMALGVCQALGVHLLTEDRQALELVAQRELTQPAASHLEFIPLPPALADRIRQGGAGSVANGRLDHTTLLPELAVPQYPSYLSCYLVAGGHANGLLSYYRQADEAFTRSEISLLEALARQIGIIVENLRLRRQIREVATFEERGRLARDLHDSATQLVYSLTLFARSSQEALEDGDSERLELNLTRLAETSVQALREMRFMLFEMQPPSLESKGLAGALEARFYMVERRVGIRVDSRMAELPDVSWEVERQLYYVAIEALNNTLKHSQANRVTLALTREADDVRLCVADNGRGFDPARVKAGMGIANMRGRVAACGGEFEIDAAIGRGTTVVATVPAIYQPAAVNRQLVKATIDA